MTTTYTGDPNSSPKDAVRFLCQDTDMETGVVRLQDEEINWTLIQNSNVFLAAALCADVIATYWARIQNTRIGPLNIQHGQNSTYFQQLAEKLRKTASRFSGGMPVFYPAGDERYANTNCGSGGPQHIFYVGQDDFRPSGFTGWPPADLPPLQSYI